MATWLFYHPSCLGWQQLVFSFAAFPCLKFPGWFIIIFINEGLNSLSFSLNCMILLLASSHSTLAQTGQIWCFLHVEDLALYVIELVLCASCSAWGGWVCWQWELREKEREREWIQLLQGKTWCPSSPQAVRRELMSRGKISYPEAEMGLFPGQGRSHICGHQISALTWFLGIDVS